MSDFGCHRIRFASLNREHGDMVVQKRSFARLARLLFSPTMSRMPHEGLSRPAKRVVRFYNQRGTAEQWIKEGKNAVKWTRLSCHDFVDNQVRLQLFVLAYNLGNFLRQAVLPQAMRHWTLTTLREKLIKIGAKVVRQSQKIVFQMAEVAVPRELFRAILERIGRLRLATVLSG